MVACWLYWLSAGMVMLCCVEEVLTKSSPNKPACRNKEGNSFLECIKKIISVQAVATVQINLEDVISNTEDSSQEEFQLFRFKKSWPEAGEHCASLGGQLATIRSQQDNSAIENLSEGPIWVGGTDAEEEGVWKWVTGETFADTGFTNWYNQEPDNSYIYGGEDCLLVRSGAWGDSNCAGQFPFVCSFQDVLNTGEDVDPDLSLELPEIEDFEIPDQETQETDELTRCVFPFRYKESLFRSCTNADWTTSWCAASVNENLDWTTWKQCHACPQCVFPFSYKGVIYHTCTTADYEDYWCATKVDANYTIEKWANCTEDCPVED